MSEAVRWRAPVSGRPRRPRTAGAMELLAPGAKRRVPATRLGRR